MIEEDLINNIYGDSLPLRGLKKGGDFFAWDLDESNREDDFHCPFCDDRLIPVIPDKNIIKHFRHKNNKKHKSESKEHLFGKRNIYKIIKDYQDRHDLSYSLNPILEKKIGDKIADVYVPERHLIIEYQCSSITVDEINDRVKNARDNGDHLRWVLGGKYLRDDSKSRSKGDYDFLTSAEKTMGAIPYVDYIHSSNLSNSNRYIYLPFYFDGKKMFKKNFQKKYTCKKKGWFNIKGTTHDKDKIFQSLVFDPRGVKMCWKRNSKNKRNFRKNVFPGLIGD